MTSHPSVLVYTCAEYGHSSVVLATLFELALAGVNIHISSYASLQPRVARLQDLVRRASLSRGKHTGYVVFHESNLTPHWSALAKIGLTEDTLPHPHGVWGALDSLVKIVAGIFPWGPEEHRAIIEDIKQMVTTIKPDVVVMDQGFYPAIDACKLLGQKFVVVSPSSIKDLMMNVKPGLEVFWKYPATSSGFPFPLKWWQVPLNIYIIIRFIICYMGSTRVKEIQALRKSLGVNSKDGYGFDRETPYICPGLPEIDFTFPEIPKVIIPCGPIVMPFSPLEESDPALMKWLDNGPTVMICLGSHAVFDEKRAREMCGALRILVDYHDRKDTSKIQVLWKAKAKGDAQKVIDDIIGKEIQEGRVKVVAWVEAELVAILQHPNLICTVHHGGATSFFEGVWSGKPHVVLPVWYDTYDFANRVEFLKIGLFGNKSCAPGVRADELGPVLVRVTGNSEEARKFRSRAKQFQEVCRAKGNGRELSAMVIMKEIGMRV